jgi:hypothetical protein
MNDENHESTPAHLFSLTISFYNLLGSIRKIFTFAPPQRSSLLKPASKPGLAAVAREEFGRQPRR